MITQIICPVDFSKASLNAIEYAANFAKENKGDILLVHLQKIKPVAASVSMGEGIGAREIEAAEIASKQLKSICSEIKKAFQINAEFEIDITTKSLGKVLENTEENTSLVIMGTNGVDDLYQYYFGTNTFRAIKKTKCPLLVIPENVSYRKIDRITFTWDYQPKSDLIFQRLLNLTKIFSPEYVFLHINLLDTDYSNEVFNKQREKMLEELSMDNRVEFKCEYSNNIPKAIATYMIESNSDMLATTFHDRGIILNLIHGEVIRELCVTIEYPFLVLEN
jgi:hypothetical protein